MDTKRPKRAPGKAEEAEEAEEGGDDDVRGPRKRKEGAGRNAVAPHGVRSERSRKRGNKKSSDLPGRHLGENILGEAKPRIDGAYRRVTPYDYSFNCFVKGRWIGKSLIDVFAKEFHARTRDEYAAAIDTGMITVNGRRVAPTFELKNNQQICNIVHRHEPPVSSAPITIVHDDDDLLVINKPSSIPVHPCGRYRHNTVLALLGHEHGIWDLYPCHRLDRLTSGVLIFAKTKAAAAAMEAEISSRSVAKTYLCLVDGEFPPSMTCEASIRVVSHRVGVCSVHDEGKSCRTEFTRLGYNQQTRKSLLQCVPHTGRMHQIRVHLRYLGFPIDNDPIYNRPEWHGKMANVDKVIDAVSAKLLGNDERAKLLPYNPETMREGCIDCRRIYKDPTAEEMCLHLHAWKMETLHHSFEASPPEWADFPGMALSQTADGTSTSEHGNNSHRTRSGDGSLSPLSWCSVM